MRPEIEKLRDRFFEECTNKKYRQGDETLKVDITPHSVFEFFRPYLANEISDEEIEKYYADLWKEKPVGTVTPMGWVAGAKFIRNKTTNR